MTDILRPFSLDEFVKLEARSPSVTLQAAMFEDGDYFVLRPVSDGLSAYRVAKADVANYKPLLGTDTSGAPLYLVEITASASVLRLTPGNAADLFAPLRATLLATQRASVDFKLNGEGTLNFNGTIFPCLGSPSIAYTKDLTVTATMGVDKFEKKYSNEFQVDMTYAVLIMGARGIYIHEGADNLKDNEGPSAGCIHLAPGNAKQFYDWVSKPTRIVISYPW
ncbi:L,D-transpeptidase [Cupriavidus sp. H39]|uniref:L,D-transpeptidase n=1 Tax=Cupriavidus sp. H39 TaxID=3401635 RepID=UPI003CFF4547